MTFSRSRLPSHPKAAASSGEALAEILAGCWRKEPPPATLEASQLEKLLSALAGSGAGALAWRRLRHSALAKESSVLELQKIYFRQALDAKVQEREIARILGLLQGWGIGALLVKGWATAQLYPEVGARSVGDIDLLIHRADKAAAESALGVKVDDETNSVLDIKSEVPALYDVRATALFARSERAALGEIEVRVLGAEDHLRILCLHFLKHGAWRPSWLCDVAVALESRPASFDWDLCLGKNPRVSDGIACALGLAHHLLGAGVANTPVASRAARLPAWLVPAVLREWETPQISQHQPAPLLIESLRERVGARQAVLKRWPNPVQAAMQWKTPLSWPPLPAQTAAFAASSLHFMKRAPRLLRENSTSTQLGPSKLK
jgi:hypothetical protein